MTTLAEIINDPATRHWLREAAYAALRSDPVDALNDAELLLDATKAEHDAIAAARSRGGALGRALAPPSRPSGPNAAEGR